MVVQLPACPASLKNVQPYLKTALEHDERDPVVSYWCRLYSLQTALTIDKKSDEAKVFLLLLMDWLETTKRSSTANESITSETVAHAYIENYALKLFIWADNMDRSANFSKNVVKSFYTAGMLMDVLTVFGELGEDIVKNRKYAKWKAAYIHNCLKNGETPLPGPQHGTEEDELNELLNVSGNSGQEQPPASPIGAPPQPPDPADYGFAPNAPSVPSQLNLPNTGFSYNPHPTPASASPQQPVVSASASAVTASGGKLDPTQITKAQKYCKFASSALNYDDIPEAIANLQKALKLLQTGSED